MVENFKERGFIYPPGNEPTADAPVKGNTMRFEGEGLLAAQMEKDVILSRVKNIGDATSAFQKFPQVITCLRILDSHTDDIPVDPPFPSQVC